MRERTRSLWLSLSANLGFVPGVIVALFAALGIVLVEIDRHVDLSGVNLVFAGDGPAARTVLSVIAGSLITVAGLTFSITMVVLQLASSQFSPRVLRTLFADRMTQVTIGVYVGTFVYSILVLRAVGSFGSSGFVPRLSVTLASLLGIGAAILLIAFLHHVSRLVQVSYVTAGIARATLARADALYPAGGAPAPDEDPGRLLAGWRATPPAEVRPARPGYVQRLALDGLAERLGGRVERVAILVCPGDFVSIEMPITQLWPRDAGEEVQAEVGAAMTIASERDLDQDVDFGLRQLTDTAVKAMSPGINDPTTARTCVGYVRSILVLLAERRFPEPVRRFPDRALTVVVRRREFDEHLAALEEIGRHAGGDPRVAGAVLDALASVCDSAARAGIEPRAAAAAETAASLVAAG
jgi:uncharacterized membrane protein